MQEFAQLVEIIKNYVEIEDITTDDNFKTTLEMSSFDIMCLVTDVKSVFGVDLKANDFVNYKTVGEMSQYIADSKN